MAQPHSTLADGVPYENAYFLKIDASGHSSIVSNNASDLTNKAFDLFERAVRSAVEDSQKLHDCAYATFWGWQGDGGLCVFHDPQESVTLETSISAALDIVNHVLDGVRSKLTAHKVKGHLSIRLAIHKGVLTFKENHGSIHSEDLNFVAHLEAATPRDSLTISDDVHKRLSHGSVHDRFERLEFPYENRIIWICSRQSRQAATFEWLTKVPLEGSFRANVLSQRMSEIGKALLIQNAEREIVDLGTALNTCSNYLVSRAKPGTYRSTVLKLLERGVDYVCLALDPNSKNAEFYGNSRKEDLVGKIRKSLDKLKEFRTETMGRPGRFRICLYDQLPYCAAILLDRERDGAALFAPYMPQFEGLTIERQDSPHMFVTRSVETKVFQQIVGIVNALLHSSREL